MDERAKSIERLNALFNHDSAESFLSFPLILAVIGIIILLIWLGFRSYIRKQAENLIGGKVLPVWATLGPFNTGKESSAAFKYACIAIMGPEEAEKMRQEVSLHAIAYDSNPEKWEKARQNAEPVSPDLEDFITLAKGVHAMESLNDDFLKLGHKLELRRKPDGRLGFASIQTMSDEAIKEKKSAIWESIFHVMGEGLLNDSSQEARALVYFLTNVCKANLEKEDISAADVGKAWLVLGSEDPQSEIFKEFKNLGSLS